MRGAEQQQAVMFSYLSPEDPMPQDHPWCAIRVLVDVVLKELSL
jgi:hypothetical protein